VARCRAEGVTYRTLHDGQAPLVNGLDTVIVQLSTQGQQTCLSMSEEGLHQGAICGRCARRLRRQSGKAGVEPEVPEPEVEHAAACQMHYPGQQDEGKDDQHKPRKEQHNARDGAPGYSLGHGPTATRRRSG
jgi:hypothetical protein